MGIWRKRTSNLSVIVPDWNEPCTDVLQLPSMLLENGNEGYFRSAANGPLGKAAEELLSLYKAYCHKELAMVRYMDGSSVESEIWRPDEDLLVSKLYGQVYDVDMRVAFARCLLQIGANPAEIIAIGERVYSEYVEEEAERVIVTTRARDDVDDCYGSALSQYLQGEVLAAFRDLLVTMTLRISYVPEVVAIGNQLAIALEDIEEAIDRKLPRSPRLPDHVTRVGARLYETVSGLARFGYAELREWYFEDQDNERISGLYYALTHLQYELLSSTTEGRQILDNLFSSLFEGNHKDQE